MDKHLQKIEKLIEKRNGATVKIDSWHSEGLDEEYLRKLRDEVLQEFKESLPDLPLALQSDRKASLKLNKKRKFSPQRTASDKNGSRKLPMNVSEKNPNIMPATGPKRSLGKRQCVPYVSFDPAAPYVSTQEQQRAKQQQTSRNEEQTFQELRNTYGDGWKRVAGKGEHKNTPGGVICNPNGVPYILKRNPRENVDFFTSVLGALQYCQEHCEPISDSGSDTGSSSSGGSGDGSSGNGSGDIGSDSSSDYSIDCSSDCSIDCSSDTSSVASFASTGRVAQSADKTSNVTLNKEGTESNFVHRLIPTHDASPTFTDTVKRQRAPKS